MNRRKATLFQRARSLLKELREELRRDPIADVQREHHEIPQEFFDAVWSDGRERIRIIDMQAVERLLDQLETRLQYGGRKHGSAHKMTGEVTRAIDDWLSKGKPIAATELCRRLDISRQSLYSYLKSFRK